jgi:hypothetical protein
VASEFVVRRRRDIGSDRETVRAAFTTSCAGLEERRDTEMPAKDPAKATVTAERSEPEPGDDLKAYVEGQLEEAKNQAEIELTVSPPPPNYDWEVVGWGPWQLPFNPAIKPGRIIFTGDQACVAIAVILNASTAANLAGFGASIELNYFTSNMQAMTPVPALSHESCIPVVAGKTFYVDVFCFTPSDPACLYEMNVCARICNCNKHTVPGFAGFVRHVFDFDRDNIPLIRSVPLGRPPLTPPGTLPTTPRPSPWAFDRPIRFMVARPDDTCCPAIP